MGGVTGVYRTVASFHGGVVRMTPQLGKTVLAHLKVLQEHYRSAEHSNIDTKGVWPQCPI